MNLPIALGEASRQGRLLALWGELPFPLAARPPANRALLISRWIARAEALPPPALSLPELPPLPILSLDPGGRLEEAFARAGLPLGVVRSRRDVPGRGQHVLLKLGGDLATRSGLVLSRAELRDLQGDPDKRHLLDEARRLAKGGALLLLGTDPDSSDFQAWWPALAPVFRDVAVFALGGPSAAWPERVPCLDSDFETLKAGLWAARPEPEITLPDAPLQPGAGEYTINVYGPVQGLTIGNGPRVEGHFVAPAQTVQGDWEALVAQVTARLDAISVQLGSGVADLKRGQTALYRQVDRAYRDDLARVLAAVQLGRLDQAEMRVTLETLRRAMRAALNRGLPMDAELRAAVADLTEAVESQLTLEHKLELALPLLPLLTYKIELGVGRDVDLRTLWNELRACWQHLVGHVRE